MECLPTELDGFPLGNINMMSSHNLSGIIMMV